MVSKEDKRYQEAKQNAKARNLPLLFFLGKNPMPKLLIPQGVDRKKCKTVIISGSDPDLHQLRRTPRSQLRANIERALQNNSLGTIKSFIFDLNKQDEYKTKRWFVGKPNKSTQLYWALRGLLVPWNRKTTAGAGISTTTFWDAEQPPPPPGSKQDVMPTILFMKTASSSANFAPPLPTRYYQGVGFNAAGVFQPMALHKIWELQDKTKPFGYGGAHRVYNIPETNYVLGKYSERISHKQKQVRSHKKRDRIEQLQSITKRSFAHLPVHVDDLTGDYYAEKMDGDLFDALTSNRNMARKNWVQNWTPEQAAQALHSFLAGVQDLHQKDWVHGDIKPGNIYLQGTQLKLADWDTACKKDAIIWDHATPTYSQFKITNYGLKTDNPKQYKQVNDLLEHEKLEMAKCTDLLATIQSFYVAYLDSGLFKKYPEKLATVKEKLEDILDIDDVDHERTPPNFSLVTISKDGKKLLSDKRYTPKNFVVFSDYLENQIGELNLTLKAVMPANIAQISGEKSAPESKDHGTIPASAASFSKQGAASMERSIVKSPMDEKATKRGPPHGQKGPG